MCYNSAPIHSIYEKAPHKQVKYQTKTDAWVSQKNADPGRSQGSVPPPSEGPQTSDRLKSAGPATRWISLRTVSSDAPDLGRALVYIGIPKQVVPLATRRNRIKRLIREAIRKDVRFEPGMIYRIRVEKMPEEVTYARIEKDVLRLFK